MSESQSLLCATAGAVFSAAAGMSFEVAWSLVEEAGLPALLVPERAGGFGGDWCDFVAVMKIAGACALALPLGETILVNRQLARSGIATGPGPKAIAVRSEGTIDGTMFSGKLKSVAFGRHATGVLVQCGSAVAYLNRADALIVPRAGVAGDPCDDLEFGSATCVALDSGEEEILQAGAIMRVAQSAGAIARMLEMTVAYANERQQFGRPLSKFQAVQQNIAILAGEAAAVDSAAQSFAQAADAARCLDEVWLEAAAAKCRANIAMGQAFALAHQAHGAIGFTQEYPLQRLSRRLLSWRSEFGNDRYWSERLGGHVARLGGDGLWERFTDAADRCP